VYKIEFFDFKTLKIFINIYKIINLMEIKNSKKNCKSNKYSTSPNLHIYLSEISNQFNLKIKIQNVKINKKNNSLPGIVTPME
jgi:hypothetical protein